MSILVLGGDKVATLREMLSAMGVTDMTHWPMRKSGEIKRELPQGLDGIVMLTDYLSHNAMKRYKRLAKERGVPLICSRHCGNSVCSEFCRIMASRECPMVKSQRACG